MAEVLTFKPSSVAHLGPSSLSLIATLLTHGGNEVESSFTIDHIFLAAYGSFPAANPAFSTAFPTSATQIAALRSRPIQALAATMAMPYPKTAAGTSIAG